MSFNTPIARKANEFAGFKKIDPLDEILCTKMVQYFF